MYSKEVQQWRREGLLVFMGVIREDFMKEVAFNPNLKVCSEFKLEGKKGKVLLTEGLAQANAWTGEQVEGLFG